MVESVTTNSTGEVLQFRTRVVNYGSVKVKKPKSTVHQLFRNIFMTRSIEVKFVPWILLLLLLLLSILSNDRVTQKDNL